MDGESSHLLGDSHIRSSTHGYHDPVAASPHRLPLPFEIPNIEITKPEERVSPEEEDAPSFFESKQKVGLLLFMLAIPLVALYAIPPGRTVTSPLPEGTLTSSTLPTGQKIHLSSAIYNSYVQNSQGNIEFLSKFPYQHGSTFEVFRLDEECFQLRSMKHTWLRLDYKTGEMKADGEFSMTGSYFSAVEVNKSGGNDEDDNVVKRNTHSHLRKKVVRLKLCRQDMLFEIAPNSDMPSLSATDPLQLKPLPTFKFGLTKSSMKLLKSPLYWLYGSLYGNLARPMHRISRALLSLSKSSTAEDSEKPSVESEPIEPESLLQITFRNSIHGVNLGGWFIPEVWVS